MDDNSKRTALALILSIMVIFFYLETNKPQRVPNQQVAQQQQIVAQPTASESQLNTNSFQAPTNPDIEREKLVQTAKTYTDNGKTIVKTDLVEIELSHRGARFLSYKLNDFKATIDKDDLLDIVDKSDPIPPLGVYIGAYDDSQTNYSLVNASTGIDYKNDTFTLRGDQQLTLTFSGIIKNQNLNEDVKIEKSITFSNQNYYFSVSIKIDKPIDNANIWLEWTSFEAEDSGTRWNPKTFVLLQQSGDRVTVPFQELNDSFKAYQTKWAVLGDNYFVTAVVPTLQSGQNTMLSTKRQVNVGAVTFTRLAGDKTFASFDLYAGPKEEVALQAKPYGLEQSIDLGFFAIIGQPILIILELFYSIFHNYGLAIILLTLLVKTLLLPLTCKSFKSMRAMQEIKPEMDALRAKIKDPNQLNQEFMALYKRKGVNPMGGGLPMLIQMPVFFGMYNALRVSFNLRHQPYALWINDLAAPEALKLFGINIPIMILIMGAAMFIQQVTTPSPGMSPEQKKMMYITPIIFTVMFLFWPFPSGLVLYMLVNNFISIVQQVSLRSKSKITPLQATAMGSVVIFGVGYILTLL